MTDNVTADCNFIEAPFCLAVKLIRLYKKNKKTKTPLDLHLENAQVTLNLQDLKIRNVSTCRNAKPLKTD